MFLFQGLDEFYSSYIKSIQWYLLGTVVLSFILYSFFSPFIISIAALSTVGWVSYRVIKNKLNESLKLKVDLAKQQSVENESLLSDPLFDILSLDNLNVNELDNLEERANHCIGSLNNILETLSIQNWREHPWIVDSKLNNKKNDYKKRLNTQKFAIQNKKRILADNIAKDIKSKIIQLKPTFTKSGKLTPVLKPLELERLVAFVNAYGSEPNKKSLSKNIEFINIFIEDLNLKNAKFIYKNKKSTLDPTPWGGYSRFKAHFKGWKSLIEGWMIKGAKKQAMVDLLAVLEGTLQLTPVEFNKRINLLGSNKKLKNLIQQHLFLLLHESSQVLLLSIKDQEKIHAWFKKNELAIQAAQVFIEAVFEGKIIEENLILENLARHIQWLDYAALIGPISKIKPECIFEKRAKIYFQQYKGDHSLAHCLVRFLPPSPERAQLLHQICTKRLYWSIEQAQIDALDFESFTGEKNTNLFNDTEGEWNFDVCAKKHSYYNQYTVHFEKFLQEAAESGFCKESLVTQYRNQYAKV